MALTLGQQPLTSAALPFSSMPIAGLKSTGPYETAYGGASVIQPTLVLSPSWKTFPVMPPVTGVLPTQTLPPTAFSPVSKPVALGSPRSVRMLRPGGSRHPTTGRLEDAMPDDGPISVAFGLRESVQGLRPVRPCPATGQYMHRGESEMAEMMLRSQPRRFCDVHGMVQAAANDANHPAANADELELSGVKHNALRLVYASISGWTLNFWSSQEDFQASLMPYGAPRGTRPIASWDLHQAYDVDVDFGNHRVETCCHRVRVMMYTGNLYFRVEMPEDVPVWLWAIRSLIKEACWDACQRRDRESHQLKRWPAARGIAHALFSGSPIGERALAILFHCYDLDCDSALRTGDIMLLIQELLAGRLANEDRKDSLDRGTAVQTASSHLPQDELYKSAVVFRRVCCPTFSSGCVRKGEFISRGHAAMLQAFGLPVPNDLTLAGEGQGEDVCTLM